MHLLIKTMAGLEPVLARELEELGVKEIRPLTRAVACRGDRRLLYRANLELRTALRVLTPVASFPARSEDELYRGIARTDWSQYMNVDDTLAVDAVSASPHLRHSKYVALKTKDAVVDQFRRKAGLRPDVNVGDPTLRINVHAGPEEVTVSLDASGDSLHRRGYRTEGGEAPINEVLAAGLVLLTGWQRDRPFLDPMCGSGTILIEAALYAHRIPPQSEGRRYGFMHWKDYDRRLWENVLAEARARIAPFPHPIGGYDRDFRAVNNCRHNLAAAGLDDRVQVERRAFEKLTPPFPDGLIVMNPPYDERLPVADVEALYRMIGDRLKQEFAGYEAWIISSNKDALKYVGLRPSRKFTLFNGPLECKYQKYELFSGSRKERDTE